VLKGVKKEAQGIGHRVLFKFQTPKSKYQTNPKEQSSKFQTLRPDKRWVVKIGNWEPT
jgi:hypothetical protein